jgi:hypothetical protein
MLRGAGEALENAPAPKLPLAPARRWPELSPSDKEPACDCAGDDWPEEGNAFVALVALDAAMAGDELAMPYDGGYRAVTNSGSNREGSWPLRNCRYRSMGARIASYRAVRSFGGRCEGT